MSSELSKFSSILYRSSERVPTAYLPLFHVYNICDIQNNIQNANENDLIFKDAEVLVIVRNMVGKDHPIGIGKTMNSSTIFLMVAHILNVHHKQISLFGDTYILNGDEPMSQLLPLLAKTKNVLQVVINEPGEF